jgi:plastocyanin
VPRRRRSPRTLLAVAALVVGALAACGDDEPSGAPADCDRITDGAVTLVGENLAWDTDCLRVDEATEITFTVDLRDDSVDHNLSVFGPSGREKTPLERGPITQTLVYDATTSGRHEYVCDIHPSMEGELWVDPAR